MIKIHPLSRRNVKERGGVWAKSIKELFNAGTL